LEPGGEWMCEKILLCAFSVRVQSIADYYLKFGGRGGRRLSVRHERESREFEGDGGYLGGTVIVGQRVVVHLGAACLVEVRESISDRRG
jgi:hypothetical protein